MPAVKKPDALKVLTGSYRPCRAHKPAVVSDSLGPPPDYLSPDERTVWLEIQAAAPVLSSADTFFLATTCRLEAEYRRLGSDMPAARIGHLLKCLCKLGLNPVDRNNVIPPEPDPNNPFLS